MIIIQFYHLVKTENNRYKITDIKYVPACGTDSVYRLDARKNIFNLISDGYDRAKKLSKVKKYDYFRLHRVDSYRDHTDEKNAISDFKRCIYDS